MKKVISGVAVAILFLYLLPAQEEKDQIADITKNLQIVEKTEAIPAKTKIGYDAINAKVPRNNA